MLISTAATDTISPSNGTEVGSGGGNTTPEGYTLEVTGSEAEAARWEKEADAAGRDPKAMEKLWMAGIVYEALESHENASRVYGKIADRFPSDRRSADAAARAGDQLVKANKNADAANSYRKFLSSFPSNDLAPFVHLDLCRTLLSLRKWDEAKREAAIFPRLFGAGSTWNAQEHSPELKGQVEGLRLEAELIPAFAAHIRAQEEDSSQHYKESATLYREFLNRHPAEAVSYRVNYLLAECLADSGDAASAAKEYLATAQGYTDDARYRVNEQQDFTRADAANNSIFYYYELWRRELADAQADVGVGKLQAAETALANNSPIPVRVIGPSETSEKLLSAVEYFISHFPKDPRISDNTSVKGEIYFWYGRYSESRALYKSVLDSYAGTEASFIAAENIALSFLVERNHKEASTWYSYLGQLGRDKHRESLYRRADLMAGGVELLKVQDMPELKQLPSDPKQAEKVHVNAAKAYQKVADSTKVQDVRDLAWLRAGEEFLLAKKNNEAENSLKKIIENKTPSRYLWNAYYGMAEINLENKKYDKAQDLYRQALAKAENNPEGIARCHFALARIYKEQGKRSEALAELEGLANARHAAPANVTQAYYLQGEIMVENGNHDAANGRYGNAFLYYQGLMEKGKPDPDAAFWAGKARLQVAADYESRAIEQKLIGDDAKDRVTFTKKMDYYTKARDACFDAMKTRNAPAMSEALFRLGSMFERISEDVLSAPRPMGLSQEEARLYDTALAGQMNPLVDKAVGAYSKCVGLGEYLKYEDEWTKKSKARLNELGSRGGEKSLARAALTSDVTWKATGLVSDSTWNTSGYNDSTWSQARDVSTASTNGNSLLGSSAIAIWSAEGDSKAHLRSRANLNALPVSHNVTVNASGKWILYINGKAALQGDGVLPVTGDIASSLIKGENTIAVEVAANAEGRGFFTLSSQ